MSIRSTRAQRVPDRAYLFFALALTWLLATLLAWYLVEALAYYQIGPWAPIEWARVLTVNFPGNVGNA